MHMTHYKSDVQQVVEFFKHRNSIYSNTEKQDDVRKFPHQEHEAKKFVSNSITSRPLPFRS